MYEDLAAPTAATANVFAMAALAVRENRVVKTVDIGGAYLNASMAESGVIVHMRLDKVMTTIVVKIDPKFAEFVTEDGSSVVQLDKALYGCVEAAHLWYLMLREKLEAYGFEANPAEPCVFNKLNEAGVQISLTLHVDDLLTTCTSETEIDIFFRIPAYSIPSYHSPRGENAQLSRNDVRLPRRRCSILDDAEDSRRCSGGMRGG